MEDDVGPGSALGVSKLPLSGELPSELLFGSMDCENQVEGSYEEGEEVDVMVDIVGSDLIFNGVSGHNGDLEGHEWENREENGNKKNSEVIDVWNEGDVLHEEVWNPEIGATVVASSAVEESTNEQSKEVTKTTSVVTSEEKVLKCKAVDRGSGKFVKSKPLSRSVETVVEGKVQISEKEGILHLIDYDADSDQLGDDSVTFHRSTSTSEGAQIVPPLDTNAEGQGQVGEIDGCVGEVGLFDATEGEVSAESIDLVYKVDSKVSNIQDVNQGGGLEESQDTEFGPAHGTDDASRASLVSQPDGHGVAEFNKSKVVNIEIQACEEEKQTNMQVDSGIHGNKVHLSTSIDEVIIDPNLVSSHVKVVNGDRSTDLAISGDEVNKYVKEKDACSEIGMHGIENTGVHEESSGRCDVYHSSRETYFEPDKLLEGISTVAPCASSSTDGLDLVTAQEQLSGFCRFMGYRPPTEFPSSGELIDNDLAIEQVNREAGASGRSRCNPMDGSHSRKQRSLTELMGDVGYSPDAGDDLGNSVSHSSERKRKALDPLAKGLDKRASTHAVKLSASQTRAPRPFLKIGQCISRAAGQLTGSTSLLRGNNDRMVDDGSSKISKQSEMESVAVSAESCPINEMLSQLQLVAQDPKNWQNIQSSTVTVFRGFRSIIFSNKRDRKRKLEPTVGEFGGGFKFDDANDSYWKDRIVQNFSAEQLRDNCENQTENLQVAPLSAERSGKTGRIPRARKRFSTGNQPMSAMEPVDNVKRQKQDSSPAELIMNFAERTSVPSEINLNKIFRRFGTLMESETEVDHYIGRAKVIFKRGSDAEVALNSAEKFNIFGSVLVNYQIGYSPVISVKVFPVVPQLPEGVNPPLQSNVDFTF